MKIIKRITLYKKDKKGKQQIWTIEVEQHTFRTTEGYEGGAMTTTEWTVCEGKHIGKKNETRPQEQAQQEAWSKIKKQKDKGWSEDITEDVKVKILPMLAHKYNDHIEYVKSKEGVATQPKLDGLRCVADYLAMYSRNGKPIVSAPHIMAEIKDLIEGLPFPMMLDGELYNHDLKADFNKIMSLARKTKPTAEDFNQSEQLLQYHVYDIVCAGSFVERHSALRSLIEQGNYKYIKLVETNFIPVDNLWLIDKYYGDYLTAGYEGQMIRIPGSSYQDCRTKDLLKRKEFQDDEFVILDIEEGLGNRSGMMGRIKFKTKDGKAFDSNARGTHEYFKELLMHKNRYIGKKATVRYQNITPDGVPRFPVMIDIRNDI